MIPIQNLTVFLRAVLVVVILACLSPAGAQSFQPRFSKFHPPGPNPAGNHLGSSVALSDRYLLAGEPGSDEIAFDAGAASVFDARTQRLLRKLTAPDATSYDRFGISVAVSGSFALIGADHGGGIVSDQGAAYLFDLRNGRPIHKFTAADGAADDFFGRSVSLQGRLALVGAPGISADQGAVYLFDTVTGAQLVKFTASDGAAAHQLGESVSLSGSWALAGAPGANGLVAGSGASYVFDARAPGPAENELDKLEANDGATGDRFGASVTLDSRFVLVGAPLKDGGTGAAYLLEVTTGNQFKKLVASDGAVDRRFGSAVALQGSLALVGIRNTSPLPEAAYLFDLAPDGFPLTEFRQIVAPDFASQDFGLALGLCGNRAVFGAEADSDAGALAGAAYLVGDLAVSLTLRSMAKSGDFAPGTIQSNFGAFRGALLNPDGEVALTAALRGPGSNRNRDTGAWNTLGSNEPLFLAIKTRDPLGPGVSVGRVLGTVGPSRHHVLINAILAGSAVSKTNHRMLLRDNGISMIPVIRTGSPGYFGGLEEAAAFPEVVQPQDPDLVAFAATLRRGPGGIDATRDSGVGRVDHSGAVLDATIREGLPIPGGGGDVFGQFFGRVSQSAQTTDTGFGCLRLPVGGGTPARQLLTDRPGLNPVVVATQGDAAPGLAAGLEFSAFTGETSSPFGHLVFRATLTGPGVNRSNNEGWWDQVDGLVIRKGDEPDPGGEPDVRINRVFGFWPAGLGQVILHARLAGPGVNQTNDGVIYLWRAGFPLERLLREGEEVCGNDAPRVGVIQKVDVDPVQARYAVLCSLAGVPAARNQALFVGNARDTVQPELRRPGLALRKGTHYQAPASVTTSIRSISFTPPLDRTGAGAKGLGQTVNQSGDVVLTLVFANRAVEVVRGGL